MTLSEFKVERRISLTELASLLGFPVSTVAGWLKGVRKPETHLLLRISQATSGLVTPAELRPDLAGIFLNNSTTYVTRAAQSDVAPVAA